MTAYTNWNNSGQDPLKPPYQSCSPNLLNLNDFLMYVYGREYKGCHHDRPIRSGSKASTHSWGAALDWGRIVSSVDQKVLNERKVLLDEILPFLIWTSENNLSGIQQIHDYAGDKIWKCSRDTRIYPNKWKVQNGAGSGMGEDWAQYIHVEVNQAYHQMQVDYGKLFKRWIGDTEVRLGDLVILDEPYRLLDSRTWKPAPYQPWEVVTIDFADHPSNQNGSVIKGALINLIPVGENNSGFASLWDPDTSVTNWSPAATVNPNCVPVKCRDGKFKVIVRTECHLIIEVYAQA